MIDDILLILFYSRFQDLIIIIKQMQSNENVNISSTFSRSTE